MLFVLNRDFQIIGLASNDSEETLHYYGDILHTELTSGVSTYEFTVPKNHEDSQHIQEGNYVTFKNNKGKQLLFTIMEMEEDGNEKVVYCEDIGLDLLNETVAPVASSTAQPIAYYLNVAMYDSGWEIGVNEIAHLNRTLNYDSYTNALERILSILNAFDDAEVDFTVEFDGNTVAHQYINVYKRVGKDTGIRLNAGIDLLEARRSVSMDGLATALYGIGKTVKNDNPDLPDTITDITSIAYDDGRYYSGLGDPYVRDREANKKWSRFRNGQAQWDGYIVDIYNYDTDSPQELFNRTLSQLQKRNEPAITYEVDVNKIDADLSIGDTVTIVDPDFKPALYLQARVLSVDESQTDDSKNSIKLGNYVLLTSSIDAQLKDLQATLKEARLSWFEQNQPVLDITSTNGEAFFDNAINTTINATITRGGIDTNSAYQESDFVWTKKDRLGNTVGGWSRTGKALAITAIDVTGKSIFTCTVGGMSKQVTIFNTETTIKATSAPSSPVQGQLWLNTGVTPPRLNIYLSGVWKKVEGETGPQGPIGLQGVQGPTGSQGIQGPAGANGVSSYTHIAYATNSTGTTGFSTSDSVNKTYIGMYVDSNPTDSETPSSYNWTLIKGADGSQGIQGPTGPSGQTSYLHIAYATNATGTTGFSTTDSVGKTYIGQYTDFVSADSTNPALYSWTLIKGETGAQGPQGPQGLTGLQGIQGPTGSQGIQGPVGPAGKSSYTHIAYATNATGSTGFSTSDSVNKTYIGMYVDSNPTDSEVASSYNWTLIKGADGAQGIQGPTGANGQTSYLHIAYATNATGTTGFSTTDSVGKTYIGQYTDFTSADSTNPALYSWTLIKGETGAQGPQGPTGATGSQGVQGPIGPTGATLYTWVKYADTPTTGMSDSPTGKTYMGLAYNKTTATESSVYADYSWSLIKGETGATGVTGSQGVQGPIGPTGATLYTWIKYADTPTTGMSDLPTGKKYLGLAYNKSTATESSTYADYSWSLMYEDVEIGGRNLWIQSDAIAGYTAVGGGSITSGATNHQSMQTLTPILAGKKLIYQVWNPNKVTSANSNRVCYFNSSGTYISQVSIPTLNGTDYQTAEFVVPANTALVRLAVIQGATAFDSSVKVKFEIGSIPTAWTPAPEDVDAVILGVDARVTTTESAITADAITNTVMGTTTFNAKLAEYAKGEELAGYATTGALEGVRDTAQSAVDALNNLDLTPYVKTTQMEQLEDSITTKISQSGGVNLLRNSIGWNGIDFWTNVSGTTETIQTPQLETFGYGAGFYKRHAAAASRINQTVNLPMAGTYTLSFRMNKSIETAVSGKASACGIYVDSLPFFGKGTGSGLTNGFEEFSYTFTTTKLTADISVVIGELAEATISGLMLNLGTEPLQWSSHSTEVYNTNVRMDINGIQVMGNRDGSKTVITPDEFSGYEDGEKVFTLNGDTTEVKKLKAEQQFEMAPITIITIDNASYKGWAFI